MSFKRSSEGRVFFQTLTEEKKDNQTPQNGYKAPDSLGAPKRDATQTQIITLLKALNARLQASQADKDTLHKEIEAAKRQLEQMQVKALEQENKAKELEKALEQKGAGNLAEVKKAESMAEEAMKEMKATRKLLAEIEGRAGRNELALKQYEGKLRESEERLYQQSSKLVEQASQGGKDLEKRLKIAEEVARENERDLAKRLTKAEKAQGHIDKRLDAVLENNEKLDRKIEQAVQERSRLIRKLERIEETVLQTNEAMNARAMVLLTDQTAAAQSGAPQAPANLTPQIDALHSQEGAEIAPWWQRKWKIDAFSATTAIVVVLLIGWGINELQRPNMSDFNVAEWGAALNDVDVAAGDASDPAVQGGEISRPATSYQEADGFLASLFGQEASMMDQPVVRDGQDQIVDISVADADVAVAEAEPDVQNTTVNDSKAKPAGQKNETQNVPQANDDLGMVDVNNPEELEALLAEDPAKLGQVLNNIEPSSQVSDSAVSTNRGDARASSVAMQPAALSAFDLTAPSEYALPDAPGMPLAARIDPDQKLPETIRQIQDAAFEGSAEAQHDLAAIYTAGHGGVKQNYEKAAQWFTEAAYNGIANAQYNLGVMYHQGIGLQKNTDLAFRWYHAAAEKGHAEAQYNLGIAYIEGIGVPYDPLRAAKYFENAAQSGVMEAAYNLGLIYENGLLGDAMPDKALVWYKTAADQGSPEAKAALKMLAENLDVSLADVNRIVENMTDVRNGAADAVDNAVSVSEVPVQPVKAQKSFIPPMDETTLLIARVQEQLMQRGLYPGPADGINGMLTRDAIRSYQSQNGMDKNGEITEDLLNHMRSASASSRSTGSIVFEGENGEVGSRE